MVTFNSKSSILVIILLQTLFVKIQHFQIVLSTIKLILTFRPFKTEFFPGLNTSVYAHSTNVDRNLAIYFLMEILDVLDVLLKLKLLHFK